MQSKTKIATTFAIALVIISIAFATREKNKPAVKTTQEEVREIVQAALQKSIKNPDAEAVKAWEDSIYKNHPEMDELLNGTSTTITLSSTTQPTATDLFARDLLTKYMEAKQQGKEIDAQVQKEIVDAILGKTYVIEEPEYDGAGLTTIANPTLSDFKMYGNKMGVVAKTPYPANVVHEINIFQQLSQGGLSDMDLASLAVIKKRYESMRSAFIAISIPQELTEFHLKIIRGVDGILKALEGATTIDTDPIGSMSKITRYQEALDTMTAAIMGIKSSLIENNVSFSPNEPGHLFME
jgi:hypothetical protein